MNKADPNSPCGLEGRGHIRLHGPQTTHASQGFQPSSEIGGGYCHWDRRPGRSAAAGDASGGVRAERWPEGRKGESPGANAGSAQRHSTLGGQKTLEVSQRRLKPARLGCENQIGLASSPNKPGRVMTVCIAAVCNLEPSKLPLVVCASDRMITINDLEYEPEQTKIVFLASQTVARLLATCNYMQRLCQELCTEFPLYLQPIRQ
jgi:hypothetical protein